MNIEIVSKYIIFYKLIFKHKKNYKNNIKFYSFSLFFNQFFDIFYQPIQIYCKFIKYQFKYV